MSDFSFERKPDQRRPLTKHDTLEQTLGCRHSSPDICKMNGTDKICAFVREDGMCHHPPLSWKRIYKELKEQEDKK